MKLLAAVWWTSWFAIQWCQAFEVGNQSILQRMFVPFTIGALLTSALCFLDYSWKHATPKKDE